MREAVVTTWHQSQSDRSGENIPGMLRTRFPSIFKNFIQAISTKGIPKVWVYRIACQYGGSDIPESTDCDE
jgi:hypothetical protein